MTTVLLSADMEGVSVTATPEDVTPGTVGYEEARVVWARELNTIAAGLFDTGVTEVIVVDAHGSGANLAKSDLDPRVSLVRGRPRRFGMLEGIDDGPSAVVFQGYHGGPGSGGILAHSYVATGVHTLKINGSPAGEGSLNAALAASFGVPVILVTGDDSACAEAERYAPSAERVVVKECRSRFAARLLDSEEVMAALRKGAEAAGSRLVSGELESVEKPSRVEIEIEFSSEATALAVSAVPGFEREGERLLRFSSVDVPALYRGLGAIWTIARESRHERYG